MSPSANAVDNSNKTPPRWRSRVITLLCCLAAVAIAIGLLAGLLPKDKHSGSKSNQEVDHNGQNSTVKTPRPTKAPTVRAKVPTSSPTLTPTSSPSTHPAVTPTATPSKSPTAMPSTSPSHDPTNKPTLAPTPGVQT